MMNPQEISHLYNRAAFGLPIDYALNDSKVTRKQVVDSLFESSNSPTMLDVVTHPTDEIMQMVKSPRRNLPPEQRKMLRQLEQDEDRKLNTGWLRKMCAGKEGLNEKMTFFWHDHFACRDINPIHAQSLNNTLRKNALGSFKDMLQAIAREPAMLKFLNNQQNRKNAPNENFAREVMELFTLGRGHYTEADIKESARAFTGWTFKDALGGYTFNERQHDGGDKVFLGEQGAWNGDDILRIILSQSQCAYFITDKIYRYLVNEKGNEKQVTELAKSFYKSGYDIGALVREILMADWFYDVENIGVRIKSPIELIAMFSRQCGVSWGSDQPLLLLQRVLSQVLFNPPNVAGWPNGKEWIDSASMTFRTHLGVKAVESSDIGVSPKPDDDAMPNQHNRKANRLAQLDAHIAWQQLYDRIAISDEEGMIARLQQLMLSSRGVETTYIVTAMREKHGIEKLKTAISLLTALPEYQLC